MKPLGKIGRTTTARDRLQARILKNTRLDPETGCRRWILAHNNQGYPTMNVHIPGLGPVKLFAHRVALTVFDRPPQEGEEAAHDPTKCPHKDCCEPDHLRWATRTENEADKRHPSRLRLREVHPPLDREEAIAA